MTEVARSLARAMGRNDLEPEIVGKARIGDIRHCFRDTALTEERLGFTARQDFETGLVELAELGGAADRGGQGRDRARRTDKRGLVA
ncbi:hypothetical protein AB5I41_29650 [Sphingomonas sp. MMS24-JH45]